MDGILGRVFGKGKVTVFAVTVALVLVTGTTALAGTGSGTAFNLGKINTVNALSTLVGNTASSMLKVDNDGTGTALDLQVGPSGTPPDQKTIPPMRVDSQAKVTNLNADEIDGKDSTDFAAAGHDHDGRYYASGSQVADSDKLDGKDSSNFLPTGGKAQDSIHADRADNADRLDGRSSEDFIHGQGRAYHTAIALSPGWFYGVLGTDQGRSPDITIGYNCPSSLTATGLLRFTNNGTDTINVFYDVGETNPGYKSLGQDGEYFDLPTHPDGEFVTYQVQGAGVATIEVFTVHRPGQGNCHVQTQTLITR